MDMTSVKHDEDVPRHLENDLVPPDPPSGVDRRAFMMTSEGGLAVSLVLC
jgi:hypothetical protein